MKISHLVNLILFNLWFVKVTKRVLLSTQGRRTQSYLIRRLVQNNKVETTSATSACTSSYEWLSESNETKHFAVKNCKRSYSNDEQNFVQVKPHDVQYHIYCPESFVIVEGIRESCPNDVWTSPMKSNFKIYDVSNNGSRISMVHQET